MKLSLYYPITSKQAILLTDRNYPNVTEITQKEVKAYNDLIILASEELIVSTNSSTILNFKRTVTLSILSFYSKLLSAILRQVIQLISRK